MRVYGQLGNQVSPVINHAILLGGIQGSRGVPWWAFGHEMVLGDILVLILLIARASSFEVTGDTIKRQQDCEGWATAVSSSAGEADRNFGHSLTVVPCT